ncbi:MAG: hypothetical protein IJL19_05105 [Clostridiales bacterium]|nr:hypothetical protein [Clostridiales bacterium]
MYVICYGKSPKALEVGQKLIKDIGGRSVTGTELITGSFVVAEGETSSAIVMILPLEAAIKSMEETVTDKTRDLPVIAVSPEGRYAAVIRRGGKTYEKGTDAVYNAVVKALGPFCFSGFEGMTAVTADLTSLIARYNMSVNDDKILEAVNARINAGEKVDVYTDLPVVFADPVIDPMTYSLHNYPYDLRDDFIRQYKASKAKDTAPAVFITCTYLGDDNDCKDLILVPKLLSLGIEIKVKTDPGYCCPAIRKSLINHLLNPKAVARVAATYSARDSEIIKGIADELDSEVISYEADKLAKANAPMSMTFNPEKKNDTATALAFLASSAGGIVIRRSTSAKGLVLSVAIDRNDIILPE